MKKKKRKIKGSKIRMLILIPISCLIIGYFLYLIISYPYSIIKLKKEQSVYEKQLLQLEIDEKNLKNEIEKLKSSKKVKAKLIASLEKERTSIITYNNQMWISYFHQKNVCICSRRSSGWGHQKCYYKYNESFWLSSERGKN